MSTTVDSLDIQISANAQKASNSLNGLVTKLNKINSSLGRVSGDGMARMATGVSRLATAMTQINNIQTTDFTRLAKNMAKMGNVDSGQIRSTAVAIAGLTKSLDALSKVSVSGGAAQISDLVSAISKLGYKSATQAIANIPQLATAMMDLMNTLSKAPMVSQNLIDMTNALAKLARTGASSGRAVKSLSGAFDVFSRSSTKARKKSFSLASAIGKLYASYFLLFRAIGGIRESVDIASGLTEVQNVVDVTFGKYSALIDKMAETSIQDLGMSELTLKQVASGFQAMGTAMGFTQEQMAKMSIDLTKLTADMSSFYNINQKDMATSLKAIFTGETEPLRRYGLDLTEATLQQFAFSQGIGKSVNKMTQMEKSMLRYQYVMANTTAAQGDFLRTQDTWENQTRILSENLKALGAIGGGVVINTLKPLVKALNHAMVSAIQFAETISEALGTIFGWKVEFGGGITQDMEEVDFSTGDISDNLGSATVNANKLKKVFSLMPFDQLNQLASNMNDASGNGGSGLGNTGVSAGSGIQANIVPMEGLLKKYTSEINSLYKLGEHIGKVLTETLKDINWGSVYLGAAKFGKGLAEFLNGLISPELFTELGETIADSLNTAIHSLYSFAQEFQWVELGNSISAGINSFFKKFKAKLTANTFEKWAHGILDTIITAIEGVQWEEVGKRIKELIEEIEWIPLLKKVGKLIWTAIESALRLEGELFNGNSVESKIIATILRFKFLGLGKGVASKIWTAIFGSKITKSGTKSGLIRSILTGLKISFKSGFFTNGIVEGFGTAFKYASNLLGGAGTPAFDVTASKILDIIGQKMNEHLPQWAVTAIGNIGAAMSLGGLVGSLIPGFGPVAGIILGAIAGALGSLPYDEMWNAIVNGWNKLKNKTLEIVAEVKDGSKEWWENVQKWWKRKVGRVEDFIATVKDDSYYWWQSVQKWWSNKVGAVEEFLTNVKNDAPKWWEDVKTYWKNKVGAVEDFVTQVADDSYYWWRDVKHYWSNKVGSVQSFFTNVRDDSWTWWSNVYNWWRNKVGYVSDFFVNVRNNVITWWNNVASWWSNYTRNRRLTATVQTKFQVNGENFSGSVRHYADGGIFKGGSWKPVTMAASGGMFNMGQLFVAREAGPELVGTIGGHTAVVNNDQIVASVSAGVYSAVARAMSEVFMNMNFGNNNAGDTILMIDGREVARAVNRANERSGYRLNP